jgi:hypothetical protein
MSAPLAFLRRFAGELRAGGIRFAVTSGMACVHYGLQQTTKYSDWIIAIENLDRFRALLVALENRQPPWRISYRAIFGAPLEMDYMAHGWTSHLLVTEPDGLENKVDLFCKAPRVRQLSNDPEDSDFAARAVVAQMKRTDRPKDCPMVDSLGWQMLERDPSEALVHLQDAAKLLEFWSQACEAIRAKAVARRPLLRLLERETDADRLDGFLRLERMIWECVNSERYGLYSQAWKKVYRAWQNESDFAWPVAESFALQHQRLATVARRLGLEHDPVGAVGRAALLQKALGRAVVKAQTTTATLALVQPPISELLP